MRTVRLQMLPNKKMKEINEAYDTINQLRQKGRGSGSTSNATGGYSHQSTRFHGVRIYIQRNMINEAEQILDNTEQQYRDAEWHYLKGMCAYRKGLGKSGLFLLYTGCKYGP